MKKFILFLFFTVSISVASYAQPGANLNAEPGKCYAKCLKPAKYETVSVPVVTRQASSNAIITPATFKDESEQILSQEGRKVFTATSAKFEKANNNLLAKEGYTVLKVIPATFETVTEQILVKEGYKVTKVIPATYKTETFQKMVKPGYTTYTKKPAKYKTETETIETSPASTKWVKKRSGDNCLSADPDDCMIWCLVEVPATYKTVQKQVKVGCDDGWTMRGDDCVKENKVDPVYKTYTKKIIDTPARVEYTDVPPKYETRTYQKVATPARVEEQKIAPVYKDYAYQKLTTDAGATESTVPEKYVTRQFKSLASDASISETPVAEKVINVNKTNLVNEGGFAEWKEVSCELVTYSPLPINWNLGSATLTASAKRIIDERLYPILKQGFTVELASHTDSRGSDSFNLDLSERRAKAVKKYLVSKGISSDQMIARGYGETRLTNRCSNGVNCSDAEHRANRRTEFKVLK